MNSVYSADNAPTGNDGTMMIFFFGQTTNRQYRSFKMMPFSMISSSIGV